MSDRNPFAASEAAAQSTRYEDIWLVAGQRIPFADYNGPLRDASATDLGICAARTLFAASDIPASEVNAIVAGNMAQSSFDTYYLRGISGCMPGLTPMYRHCWCSDSVVPGLKPSLVPPTRSPWARQRGAVRGHRIDVP